MKTTNTHTRKHHLPSTLHPKIIAAKTEQIHWLCTWIRKAMGIHWWDRSNNFFCVDVFKSKLNSYHLFFKYEISGYNSSANRIHMKLMDTAACYLLTIFNIEFAALFSYMWLRSCNWRLEVTRERTGTETKENIAPSHNLKRDSDNGWWWCYWTNL